MRKGRKMRARYGRCLVPVVGLLALRSIPCPFLLTSVSQGADPCTRVSQAALPTGFMVRFGQQGHRQQTGGQKEGRRGVFLPFSLLWPASLVVAGSPPRSSSCWAAPTMAPGLSGNSSCTVHPVVRELPLLSSRSCRIPWSLGSSDIISSLCLLFLGMLVAPCSCQSPRYLTFPFSALPTFCNQLSILNSFCCCQLF